jgi:hypothetical protein
MGANCLGHGGHKMILYQVFWWQELFDVAKNGSFVQLSEDNLAKKETYIFNNLL